MARRDAAAPLPQQRTDVEVNLMHADRFSAQGQTAQAIALYRTVATTCKNRGNHRLAVTAFASVARLEGPGSDAKLHLGECLLALQQPADAARTLDQAGSELLSVGFAASALHALRLAADAEPTLERWRTYLYWSAQHGRQDEALRHLAEATGSDQLLGTAPRTAVGLCNLLLEVMPGHVPTLRRLAATHLELRQIHRAVAAIQTVLRFVPGDSFALERMAEAFAALGKGHKAAEVMLRLAQTVEADGASSRAEARRLVHRGLMWDPHNGALLALQRRYDDRPRAVASQIVVGDRQPSPSADDVEPLDLSDFVEATPYEHSIVELSPYGYAEVRDEPRREPARAAPLIPFPS